MEDRQLQAAVLAELDRDQSVAAAHVGVTAKDGIVVLTGQVRNNIEKVAAVAAARRVEGVTAIADELQVRPPLGLSRGDDDIAAAVVDRLSWNFVVPHDEVKVSVKNGWVTLTGALESRHQQEAAVLDLQWLAGVVGVSNNVTVKPPVDNVDDSDTDPPALQQPRA